MRFRLRYCGHPEVDVTITHQTLTVGGGAPGLPLLPVRVRDDTYRLDPRGTLKVRLHRRRIERP
jgi:hypothetical protein